MSKLIIFDADSIIFTVAWKYRTRKSSNIIKLNTNKFITDVLSHTNADDYIGFYGAKDPNDPNFRYKIDPQYKANRPETPEFVVKWGPVITDIFKDNWGFVPVTGMEADDAVAITVNKYKDEYDEIVVATFDKDLKTIPNITWYNMKKHESLAVSEFEAARFFYTQQLMGDTSDNIPGLPGIGEKTAPKLLKDCTNIYSLFRTTASEYKNSYNKLKESILVNTIKDIKEKLTELDSDTLALYQGLTNAKLERKIRILEDAFITERVEEKFVGGWKEYFKQQGSLLRMLTEAPDGNNFVIPDIQVNPVRKVEQDEVSEEDMVASIVSEELDDFLTI